MLFAASYVALQVGRNAAALLFLARDHRLREVFERLLAWSVASGALWLAGATLDPDQRLLLWIPALGLDLVAPAVGYWLPGRGSAVTTDWDIEGGHFAERCQLFIIIALGESIVVTGATATEASLTPTVALCLVIAFLETVALWWIYFGAPAERSRGAVSASDDPGRLARDAYTYVHLPIIAGIIATAAGHVLLIAEPHVALRAVGLAIVLGGPALFLIGEILFQWRTTGRASVKLLAAGGLLIGIAPLATHVSALALAVSVTILLTSIAILERRAAATPGWASRHRREGPVVR